MKKQLMELAYVCLLSLLLMAFIILSPAFVP